MSKRKKKVPVLNDEQYNAYIMSLRFDPASYNADGSRLIPEAEKSDENNGEKQS